jgi:hypothetical protein
MPIGEIWEFALRESLAALGSLLLLLLHICVGVRGGRFMVPSALHPSLPLSPGLGVLRVKVVARHITLREESHFFTLSISTDIRDYDPNLGCF